MRMRILTNSTKMEATTKPVSRSTSSRNSSDENKQEKTRGKQWSEEATATLIDLWGQETVQLAFENSKSSKQSSHVFKSLLAQLGKEGYKDISLKELINKVKKLKQKYKSEKDKSKRSGNAKGKKWKHFDKMDNILSNKHNVNPPFLVDMMAESNPNPNPVDEMRKKYGGVTYEKKCDTCDFRQEICTEGVHESEAGVIRVYSEEDAFFCPNCDGSNEADQDEEGVGTLESGATCSFVDSVTEVETKDSSPLPLKELPKKKRKSAIEKSLEIAFNKFKETSNEEFARYNQLEDERIKREHEFRLQQMALENQRRREEREHEIAVLQMLTGTGYPLVEDNSNTYFRL